MRGRKATLAAVAATLAFVGVTGAAIAATHHGSHHRTSARLAATTSTSTTATTTTGQGCPHSSGG